MSMQLALDLHLVVTEEASFFINMGPVKKFDKLLSPRPPPLNKPEYILVVTNSCVSPEAHQCVRIK